MIPLHLLLAWTVLPVILSILLAGAVVRAWGPGLLWPSFALALAAATLLATVWFWWPVSETRARPLITALALYALPLGWAVVRLSRMAPAQLTWRGIAATCTLASGIVIGWGLLLAVGSFTLGTAFHHRVR